MKYIGLFAVYVFLGLMPEMIFNSGIDTWQWWACVVPFWVLIPLRDWAWKKVI